MATPDAAAMKKLLAQGKALKNAKGDPSYQIRNGGELDDAIKAVGRVRPNTDAARAKVRRYIIGRAKALGLTSKIPGTWAADGSLKSGGDDSSSSGSSSKGGSSGSSSPASSGSSSSSTPSGTIAAETKRLIDKGMPPRVARIFATRSQKKKAA